MSEQDDFLIGNNRLDESLLMDMSDMPVEQSAAKPANRRGKSTAKRNASSTAKKQNGETAKQSNGETSSQDGIEMAKRRNSVQAERENAVPSDDAKQFDATPHPRFNSQPVEPVDVKPVSQQNSETVDEDSIDIDSLLEDPWGSPTDTGETVGQNAVSPVEQSDIANSAQAKRFDGEAFNQSTGKQDSQSAHIQERRSYEGTAKQQNATPEKQENNMAAQQDDGDMDPFAMWDMQEQSDASAVVQRNSETVNQQTGGQSEQDSIWQMEDEPLQAASQKPTISNGRQDSQADIWNIDSPEQQYADNQPHQPNGATENRQDDDLWNTGGQANRRNGISEQQLDGGKSFWQDGEQDIPEGNPVGEPARQSNRETANRQDGEQDIWGDVSDVQPVRQYDGGLERQSDNGQDIWSDNQTSETANQSGVTPENQQSDELDIWESGDDNSPYGQSAAPVAYDDIWGDEIPIQQDELSGVEPANQSNGEMSEQSDENSEAYPDDDFHRRNSIFNDKRGEPWREDDSGNQQPLQQLQTAASSDDDGLWDNSETANQSDSMPSDQYSGFPPQQFDGELPEYADDADADNTSGDDGNGGGIRRIIIMVVVILSGVALLCGGGYYAYSTYTHAQAEKSRQIEVQKKQDSLTKAQNDWDRRVSDSKNLIKEIKESLVKDDKTTLGECDKLDKDAEGNPMTEEAIKKKLKELNVQYKSTEGAYWKAMKTKSVEVSDRLKSLVEQAGKLGDAPDSSDKDTMNSLVKQWKDKTVNVRNVADADNAASSLQDAVDKVNKAKTDADNAKKAEEESKRKAEEEAQAQAQQQQSQQTYTPQRQYTYTYTPQRQYTAPKQQQSTPATPTAPSTPSQPSTGGDGNSGVMF